MNEKLKTILILLGLLIVTPMLISYSTEIYENTCLGLFEDKLVCEAAKEQRRAFDPCNEIANKVCMPLAGQNMSEQFIECAQKTRCKCMSEYFNEDFCEYRF